MSGRGRGRGSSILRSGRSYQPTNQGDFGHISPSGEVKCAPRDTSTADTVDYPLTAEGGLNKFHAPFKHERNKEAVDNTKNINEKLYTINKKPTTQILNMDINSYKIFLMAVADSDENNLVELIMSVFEKGTTYTGETLTLKIWEGLLEREDRHENIDAGEAL